MPGGASRLISGLVDNKSGYAAFEVGAGSKLTRHDHRKLAWFGPGDRRGDALAARSRTTIRRVRRRVCWGQAGDGSPPVALVVGVEPSACLTVPPGTSLNIGDHHQHVSGCGRRARQHSVVCQRSRLSTSQPAAKERMPHSATFSVEEIALRCPRTRRWFVGWAKCLRFACGFWPPGSGLPVWPGFQPQLFSFDPGIALSSLWLGNARL
jgi:hypothetical protein